MDPKLTQLAELIHKKNAIDAEIARLTGRPAQIGPVGEAVAALIFDLQLEPPSTQKGYDGAFRGGPLAGQKVAVRWLARPEGSLDIHPNAPPDLYLVMTGPAADGTPSKEKARPWSIAQVFLFDAKELVRQLSVRQVKMGAATSLPKKWWEGAEIYPASASRLYKLTPQQIEMLRLFLK